ncbi:MAG: thioredoxin domain-containing protein [Henriciella sp.]|uniref:thioredoxin domain-containing protein n=1 Tax=Henriciella sp. TaxID=1968823 RepID=UPI0032EBA496
MIGLLVPQASFAQAPLKLIALTADWCAKCHVLEPALARALEETPDGTVDYVEIDFTHIRDGQQARQGIEGASKARLTLHKAGWLWERHGATTGLAWLIATDSGEPLACFTSAVSASAMAEEIRHSARLVESTSPGTRAITRPDCPGLIE